MLRLDIHTRPNPKERRVRAVAPSLRISADKDAWLSSLPCPALPMPTSRHALRDQGRAGAPVSLDPAARCA